MPEPDAYLDHPCHCGGPACQPLPEPTMPEPDTTPAACGCSAVECEICTPISHNINPPAPADDVHVCRSGASVYFCPTAGETESDCHGGFDVCCDRPDLHQPLIPCAWAVCKQSHDGHSWEPQPGAPLVYCEGTTGRTETGATTAEPQAQTEGAQS